MLVDFKRLQGEEDLHVYLGCTPELATAILKGPDEALFVRHHIPKKGRTGGTREVWEVRTDRIGDLYKGLARRLDEFIRENLNGFPHPGVHGYVTKRSTLTNAKAHIGATSILKGDIRSFFRSIGGPQVLHLLRQLGLTAEAARVLTRVVVRENHLPLGLNTSPLLANAVCHDLDRRLASLVPGGNYTRYADDMSFSGLSLPTRLAVENELRAEGLELADEKWGMARAGRGLYVTGLSLEDGLQPRVPKEMKRRLRQDLHHARKRGLTHHFGRRGYGSLQTGINHIDGLIRYVRGIEPAVGLAFHSQWVEILKGSGCEVSYPEQGPVAPRHALFVVDESVVEVPSGSLMIVGLVVIENADLVRGSLNAFLRKLLDDPFGATGKTELTKKGLHWNDLAPEDRGKATESIRSLPFRCFLAFTTLAAQDKKTYSDTYRRLLVKLVQGRLVRYDRCTIDLLTEENSKVDQASVSASVNEAYEALGRAKSRRPASPPTTRVAPKLSEPALPLPDIVMGIFGDFARSAIKAAEEASEKKKRVSGDQADKRFEQVRDKIRAIFDLDSGEVFSRKNPFRPWSPPPSGF